MSINTLDTTRDRIVEAAGEIFAEKGFDATTVRDICQRAEANIAAVNYYFGDKQRLYVEAVVRAHRWRMERARLPEWSAETTPQKKLADFVTTFIRRIRTGPDDTWHTRLVMREMMNPREACAELVQNSIRPQFEVLVGILRELLPRTSCRKKNSISRHSASSVSAYSTILPTRSSAIWSPATSTTIWTSQDWPATSAIFR
jgi:AcrR family transcriptional regulator